MINYQLQILLVVVLGAIVAWGVYSFVASLSFEKSAANRVRDMITKRSSTFFDQDGQKIATRMGISLDSWKVQLYWAQTGGSFQNWSVGGIIARGFIMFLVVAIAVLLFNLPFIAWGLAAILFFMPFLQVRSAAGKVQKQVTRLLPETATVIAAEMDAGSTAGQALERASELPGPLGKILLEAVSKARQSNRPMFSRGRSKGILLEELEAHNLAELNRFAMQLDRVAAKGVDAPRIMIEIARGLAREYRSHVQRTAANMDTELLMPMTLFFFLPFMVVILAPMMTAMASFFA
jgi:Flp pilus assembly protein TadB